MSMPMEQVVSCPQCSTPGSFVAWQSLNSTLNPNQKQLLLKGELNRFTWSKCRWSGTVVYPMLYHDMSKTLMVWLMPGGNEPDSNSMKPAGVMEGYTFRVVTTHNELIEKIHIFDSSLDDRIIEVLKLLLRVQATKIGHPIDGELLFAKADPPSSAGEIYFVNLKKSGNETFHFFMEKYHKLCKEIGPKLEKIAWPPEKWPRVDQNFAITFANNAG